MKINNRIPLAAARILSCGNTTNYKMRYENPVDEGLVFKTEDYMYSSAIDYAGETGLLKDVIVIK